MISVTSSCTPSIVVYSWSTLSISTSTTAQPDIEDSSTRRSALPSVCPESPIQRFDGDLGAIAPGLVDIDEARLQQFGRTTLHA